MASVTLPLCFGAWAECGLCQLCVLDYACQLHRQTPQELWAEIESGFVTNLTVPQRKDIAAWVDVLRGME